MQPGFTISERGLTKFNRIYNLNWEYFNEVDLVRWDERYIGLEDRIVAVFKIKWK